MIKSAHLPASNRKQVFVSAAGSPGNAGVEATKMQRLLANTSCMRHTAHAAEPPTSAATPNNTRGASARERQKGDLSSTTSRSESDCASSLTSQSEHQAELQSTFVAFRQGERAMARIQRKGAAKTHPMGTRWARRPASSLPFFICGSSSHWVHGVLAVISLRTLGGRPSPVPRRRSLRAASNRRRPPHLWRSTAGALPPW